MWKLKENEQWTDGFTKSQPLDIVPSCLASFLPSSFLPPLLFCFSGATHPFQTGTIVLVVLSFSYCNHFCSSPLSLPVLPHSSATKHCPLLSPSLASVKQQGPCDSKLRKLPIKGDMNLTGDSQGGTVVRIKAKERVIWRCLSWTGQFPVSGTGQKYPETEKSSRRGKDTPPLFSCDTLHSANQAEFWTLSISYGSYTTAQAKRIKCLYCLKSVYFW